MMGSVEKMGNYNLKQEVTDKYSLRGRVFSKLRADILSGKYKDHEELKEVAIGEELGVSRTPVREAFRQLELEGLIQIIPNKGAYVTGITAKDVQDIYMIRSLLEGLCARWATEHRNAVGRTGGKRVSGGFSCVQGTFGSDGGPGQPFPPYFI